MTVWRSIKKAVMKVAKQEAAFHVAGAATVANRVGVPAAYTFLNDVALIRAHIVAGTAPTGAAILANIMDNASIAFTATLAAGATVQTTEANPPNTGYNEGGYVLAGGHVVTVNVTQVGSGVAGSDVTYLVVYDRLVF